MPHFAIPRCIHSPNLKFLPQRIKEICSEHNNSKKTRSELKVKVTVTQKMVCGTLSSRDAFTHQIWNSYLKEYRRYAQNSMQFLETRSEVKFKVTVTQLWYATLCHLKMHPHTKFGIPTSKNIGDMHRTRSWMDGWMDGQTDSAITICLPKFLWGHKNNQVHHKLYDMTTHKYYIIEKAHFSLQSDCN